VSELANSRRYRADEPPVGGSCRHSLNELMTVSGAKEESCHRGGECKHRTRGARRESTAEHDKAERQERRQIDDALNQDGRADARDRQPLAAADQNRSGNLAGSAGKRDVPQIADKKRRHDRPDRHRSSRDSPQKKGPARATNDELDRQDRERRQQPPGIKRRHHGGGPRDVHRRHRDRGGRNAQADAESKADAL
jgi:hypothetical protein